MIYDFHAHSNLSDGELSPLELLRRAKALGYHAIAITDHAGPGGLPRLLSEIIAECALARKHWDILAIPGVELTHLPPAAIPQAAQKAKELGAWLVVVHGETLVEPVARGTNLAALSSSHVDILAHPGLLTLREARLAAERHIFLEISARKGHCLTNGLLATLAQKAGARLLLSADAHQEGDLLAPPLRARVLQGAGLSKREIRDPLVSNPQLLIGRFAPSAP